MSVQILLEARCLIQEQACVFPSRSAMDGDWGLLWLPGAQPERNSARAGSGGKVMCGGGVGAWGILRVVPLLAAHVLVAR